MTVLKVRRGHSPNCSASGTVVGLAILSWVAAAAVLNGFADRFAGWTRRPPGHAPPATPGDAPSADPSPETEPPTVRREAFGALVGWAEPAAILWVDEAGADAALAAGGRPIGGRDAPAGALSAPTEVHLGVTDRCPVACTDCYLDAGPDREAAEPGLAALIADVDQLAKMGVFEVALGGGEALLRDDLLDLCAHIRSVGMVPNLTTSGFGVTPERAARLADLVGQVNVSLDGLDEAYRAVRGWDGTALALRAIRTLVAAGVRVGVNTVLTRQNVGALDALADALVDAGVSEWQWLRLKPAGRAADRYADHVLPPADALAIWPRLLAIEARTGLVMRIDCALVPFLVVHAPPPETLERLAVDGCVGGSSLWARGASGKWSPCSFAHDDARAASDLGTAWDHDPTLVAWRARAAAPPAPCNTCAYQTTCRGGCRIVAGHTTGDPLAPDPECPRVLAWSAA